MQPRFLAYKSSQIAWYRFGKGARLVLCFHGYGESGTAFSFLGQLAGAEYSILAIDLPHHGRTRWLETKAFEPADLQQICLQLLSQVDSGSGTSELSFSLLGFSLGGRMALQLYQLMPSQTERLVLLAPDGLKVNFWYWLSTQTWAGNRLFAYTMKKPSWFFGLLRLFNRLGWVNSSIFKFVNHYIGNEEVRQLLYARWHCLRRIKPRLKQIRADIQENKTSVRLLYGRHDRIILPDRGYKFSKGIESYCHISIIESGHQVLHEKHAIAILANL
ncbi:MAG: alpha/beta hydrolase [Chitinophagaceae bacterium]